MKKICFCLTTRGNYAKTATVIDALKDDPNIRLQYIIGGGCPEMDFYGPVRKITMMLTGSFEGTYKTAGIISIEVGCILQDFMPDVLVLVADRFEVLPVAMIAFYMGIPIAHLEGGEQSACIDDQIRDAITQIANLHFPCTKKAYEKIVQLRGSNQNVFKVGATSFDMLRLHGGKSVDAENPYLISIMHTNNVGANHARWQTTTMLWALSGLKMETCWIRPNIDTDSNLINGMMDKTKWPFIHIADSLKIEEYAPLLANAACIVGNSSSGIREASFLGTPVVNVGDRQINRERAANVIDVPCISRDIQEAVKLQIAHGPYKPANTYGDGYAGKRIAEVLLSDRVMAYDDMATTN